MIDSLISILNKTKHPVMIDSLVSILNKTSSNVKKEINHKDCKAMCTIKMCIIMSIHFLKTNLLFD